MRMIKIIFVAVLFLALSPNVSQAKGGDEQDQIILLNDSASALEETDPGLSKSLTQFADEKEKDWEDKNANKDKLSTPVSDKYKIKMQERIKLLRKAALAMRPNYPLIAQGLDKMAKDLSKDN